jgi:hypothetical protein
MKGLPCRSADFQVCRAAGVPTCGRSADLEIGDTAGSKTCATNLNPLAERDQFVCLSEATVLFKPLQPPASSLQPLAFAIPLAPIRGIRNPNGVIQPSPGATPWDQDPTSKQSPERAAQSPTCLPSDGGKPLEGRSKIICSRRRRRKESQFSSATRPELETLYVVSYFFNGLLAFPFARGRQSRMD